MKPEQLALASLLAKPLLCTVIIRAISTNQMKENILIINLRLDDKIIVEIEAIHRSTPNRAP